MNSRNSDSLEASPDKDHETLMSSLIADQEEEMLRLRDEKVDNRAECPDTRSTPDSG